MFKIVFKATSNCQKQELEIENRETFEKYYFYLLRKSFYSAKGYQGDELEFVITEGNEICNDRAKILSMDFKNWQHPDPEHFKGILAQFKQKKDFCDYFGFTRSSLSNWQKTGNISFYRWSHLLCYFGIKRTGQKEHKEELITL